MIYLDNAATTSIDPSALQEMLPYLTDSYGNAGTMYSLGRTSREAVEKARIQVANFIKASPEQIVFTSSGTEANNLAIKGLREYLKSIDKTEIISSPVEHDSVLNSIKSLCEFDGFSSIYLPTFKNKISRIVDLNKSVSDNTGLVALMYANNETGLVNPVKKIGKFCSDKNILFHCDCVQAAGCYDLDVNRIGCSTMSLSGHKFHAPKGVGALFIKEPSIIKPVLNGGVGQEFGLRAGTENVAGIVGLGYMCELISEVRVAFAQYISDLKDIFYNELISKLKEYELISILQINGLYKQRSDGKVINLRFDGIDGQTLLLALDSNGVCVSSGSACCGSSTKGSHVLLAMGYTEEEASNSIRVSFSAANTEDEVKEAAIIIADCVKELINIEY